ncbi:MAG: hypothetical protein DHS20C09_22070 [marine bacterium B5-7]|nr:MAG: hypothetical protein DHS20C09_22070 [marine bacterium B5-7]
MIEQIIKLVGFTAAVWSSSPVEHFTQLDIHVVEGNLQQYSMNKDGWFAYSVPAATGTTSMCCFNRGKQSVCDLNKKQHGFGTFSNSPATDNIHVFVEVADGHVSRMIPVGDHCEVEAKGTTVDWLTEVKNQESIEWLQDQVVTSNKGDEAGGLYVLSLHAGKQATKALYDMAAQNAGEYSAQSVFWLGQRQHDGFAYLEQLYQNLPVGEVRRKLNFALSQNHNQAAVDLLKQIAQHDRDDEQQIDAIFWLSQADNVADLADFLIDLMSQSNNEEIKEKVIFSLSQINNDEANQELAKLVNDHKDAKVREKALFWLAQNSPDQAHKAAIELLRTGQNESEQENAVFVLSQLPSAQSAAALFDIVKGNYSRDVKKKALFWLSQSEDKSTLKQLEDLL